MCKGRCDFFKRNSVVLYGVIALLVIVVLYLSCSKTNCCSKDFIIAFIAAVASMVVIGNFSQVSRIQDETEKKMKEEIEKFRKEWDDKIKAKDDDIKRLEKEIREVDFYSAKDDDKMTEKKDREEIDDHIQKNESHGFSVKHQFINDKIGNSRYYFAIKDMKNALVFKIVSHSVGDDDVYLLNENDFVNSFPDKEIQEAARNTLDDLKRFYGIK